MHFTYTKTMINKSVLNKSNYQTIYLLNINNQIIYKLNIS